MVVHTSKLLSQFRINPIRGRGDFPLMSKRKPKVLDTLSPTLLPGKYLHSESRHTHDQEKRRTLQHMELISSQEGLVESREYRQRSTVEFVHGRGGP